MAKRKAPYGLDMYRKAVYKGEFRYPSGSKQEAVLIDIDGCILDWGDVANKELLAWAKKHYDADRALIIITARTTWEFTHSFNTLMRAFPYPWTMLITRRPDDPCFAPEYKMRKAEWLSEQYDIVGAADDSKYVNTMYEWWANEYFENPADFDHLRTSYSTKVDWRKNLPAKVYPARPAGKPYYPTMGDYRAYWGPTVVDGAKHREAGTRGFSDAEWADNGDGTYQSWYDQAAHSGPETAPLDVEEILEGFAEEVTG
jgi:hypothetical protein